MIYNRSIFAAILCSALLLFMVIPASAGSVTLVNRYISAFLGNGGTIDVGGTGNDKVSYDTAARWSVVTVDGDPETLADDNHELVYYGLVSPANNFGYFKVKIGNDVRMVGDSTTGQWSKAPAAYDPPRPGTGLGRSGGYMDCEWKITTGATILVKIRMNLVRDQVRFELNLTNTGTTSKSVGLGMFGDVDVDNTDSEGYAFLPGIGRVEYPSSVMPAYGAMLSGKNVPNIFETYDDLSNPGCVARNTIGEQDCTKPDYIALGNYSDLSGVNVWLPAGYVPDDNELEDISWLMCWNQQLLKPRQTRTYVTYYGVGAASSMWTYRSGTKLQSDSALLAVQGPRTLKYDSTTGQNDLSPSSFFIKAYVNNLATDSGPYELKDVSTFLYLPPGLELVPEDGNTAKQDVGTVKINSEALPVEWKVTANGNYSGELTYYVIARAASGWQQIVTRTIMVPATKKTIFKSGWLLVNVPFTFNYAEIDHVLGLNLGSFRAIYFDPDQNTYIPVTQVEPGRSFWMLVDNMSFGQTQPIELADDTAIVGGQYGMQQDEMTVSIKSGWNMIGNPFVYPIYWGQVLVHNEYTNVTVTLNQAVANSWISKTLYAWNPDKRIYETVKDDQSLLMPWSGYWVQAKTPVTLVFRPAAFPGSSVKALPGGF